MSVVEIVPATLDHVPLILELCTETTRRALEQLSPDFHRQAIQNSDEAWCGFIDQQLVCMWVILRGSVVSNSASIWLTATTAINEHPFIFARHSQIRLAELQKRFGYIHGIVLADNVTSIKWLKWLGFSIGPTEWINDYAIRRILLAA